jgi:predicted O-methyltransferase YrrM
MNKLKKLFLLFRNFRFIRFAAPGHFYSPLPDIKEIESFKNNIWYNSVNENLNGINLNGNAQIAFLDIINKFYKEIPFSDFKNNLRYYFKNPAYSYSDGIFLYSIIRAFKPSQIIEVGSGYSSCLMLDTNDLFFNGNINMTFIEPYPKLLKSLIKQDEKITIIPEIVQNVNLDTFSKLQENDILFVDSTHVSKINSDVNYLFHKVFPILKKGVLIHIHDIFYPFEYPKQWIYEGRAWNEIYLLRAFLQFNDSFEIVAFNTYLQEICKDEIFIKFPLLKKNTGGSIWLRKIK